MRVCEIVKVIMCLCVRVCFFCANGVVIVGVAIGVCAGTRLILILVLLSMFGHLSLFHAVGGVVVIIVVCIADGVNISGLILVSVFVFV